MFEHEIATAVRSADLLREAAQYRMVREADMARRASSRSQEPRGPVRSLRTRFTRGAARTAPRTV